MAIEYSYYDYNGIIYVFGKVDSTFNSNWESIDNVIVTIDGNNDYRYQSVITYKDDTRVVFNVNTKKHKMNGVTKEQFSSGEHTVKIKFYNGTTQVGNEQTLNEVIVHCTLSSPSVTYDNNDKRLIVNRSEKGTSSKRPRYFCEIRRKNRNLINTGYTEEEKDYFYTVVMKGIEGGKFNEAHPHTTLLSYDRNNTLNLQSPDVEIPVVANTSDSPTTINSNYTYILSPQGINEYYYFKFIPSESGYYTFSSYSSGENDAIIDIYTNNDYESGFYDSSDDTNRGLDFYCQTQLEKNTTYYIKIRFWNSSTDGITKLHVSNCRNACDSEPLIRCNQISSLRVNVIFDTEAVYKSYKDTCLALVEDSLSQLKTIINNCGNDDFNYSITDSGVCSLYKSGSTNLTWDECFDTYAEYFLSDYDMTVRFGNASTTQLEGGDAATSYRKGKIKAGGTEDYYQGKWGTWLYWDATDGVAWSYATISVDHASETETLSHVTHEEIYQSLGIGDDNYDREDSIHWDPEYSNPENYEGIDKTILEMLYASNINGYNAFDCINKLDTPCLMFREYSEYDSSIDGFSFSLLDEFGNLRLDYGTYIASVWCANEGSGSSSGGGTSAIDGWDDDPYSLHTTIEFEVVRDISKWFWSSYISSGNLLSVTSAGIHPVSATEWTNFTRHINLCRNYAGYSDYAFTPVSPGDNFKSAYNEAVKAIKEVVGYGEYVSEIQSGDIAVSDCKFNLGLLTLIASEANAIVGYT